MRDRIARAAKDNRRSMNQEIISLLEAHYPEPPSLKEIETDLKLLIRFMDNPMSRSDLIMTRNLIGKLQDKIAEMSPQEGNEP
jgi:hypothetical protein